MAVLPIDDEFRSALTKFASGCIADGMSIAEDQVVPSDARTLIAKSDAVLRAHASALSRAREAGLADLRPLLLRLEWSQKTTALKNGGTIYTAITCPCCGGEKDPPPSYRKGDAAQAGHRADCELARALASGEGKGRAPADREEREG